MEQFEHKGYSLWSGEVLGHDVTIARSHGKSEFEIWIDLKHIGHGLSFKTAEKKMLTWIKSSL